MSELKGILDDPEARRVIEPKRTCNKHDDCAAADEEAKALGRSPPYHCHADDCEECFGC